jgi:polyhydroxybutyrate depolymerase
VRLLSAFLLVLGACDRSASTSTASKAAPAAETTSASTVPATPTELALPASQIYRPSGLEPGERRPLLIFLHGLGASGQAAFEVLHLAEFGARERVFVLAPDGSVDGQRRQFWNAGAACCNFDRKPIDDVARLGQLIDTWRARPDVDATRIYVMGHSNGGFMTQRLACELGDRISAAASLAGAAPPVEQTCVKAKSLALLEVHGDADPIVRYRGGSVFDSSELAAFPGAEQGFRDWATRLGCSGAPLSAADRDLDPDLPGAETRVERYPSCPAGSVELWTVRGAKHSVGMNPQAFEAIWQFLSAHRS